MIFQIFIKSLFLFPMTADDQCDVDEKMETSDSNSDDAAEHNLKALEDEMIIDMVKRPIGLLVGKYKLYFKFQSLPKMWSQCWVNFTWLEIHKMYGVRRAEVIQKRTNLLKNGEVEYFVHFDGDERRMDKWISRDDIDVSVCKTNECQHSPVDSALESNLNVVQTRQQKRLNAEVPKTDDGHLDPHTAQLEKQREINTRIKYIAEIQLGNFRISTWYFSCYPDEFLRPLLFICDRCMKYMKYVKTLKAHMKACYSRPLPGRTVYRKNNLMVIEVDGNESKLYCQFASLLGKLFIDHKTVCYLIGEFMFYVLYEVVDGEQHVAGFFSKEKRSTENNLACIVIFPPYQRKGYGSFLIQMSYAMSKREGIIGGPERPLSDIGRRAYRTYWAWEIVKLFAKNIGVTMQISEIVEKTGIERHDVQDTLLEMNITYFYNGRRVVPVTMELVDRCINSPGYRVPLTIFDENCLKWSPLVNATRKRNSI
ncbi:Histone acetyltransferase KAT8 [Trichinella britovi]|uniref:Histone acetyltransferase n=2 Tax=Trichinella britovi TaxID=45882 RepID=A0A0V1DA57_TRIBR|nr:Histone acetyltransferase KAT8 [Trichinella britovi]